MSPKSSSIAYNLGLDAAETDLVAFVHQDVYLPGDWRAKLAKVVASLDRADPNWAVFGAFGIGATGKQFGVVWDSGLDCVLGAPLARPEPAASLDELVLVLKRESGLRFDERLPGFHLYGTDIVLMAKTVGLGAFVVNLPVVHNSALVQGLDRGYRQAYRFMRQKWWSHLPWPTVVVPLSRKRSVLWGRVAALWLRKFKPFGAYWRLKQRNSGRLEDVTRKAKELGFE